MVEFEAVVERSEGKRGGTVRPGSTRLSIALVAAVTFVFWASLYVYVPILPLHAESLGGSLSMVGIVISAYAIPQVALRIPIGIWADALGRRKPFVAAGMLLAALGALGLGLSLNAWLLFAFRAATGAGAATWVAIMVLFASYYSAREVPRAMGTVMAVNSSGVFAGSLAGGLVARAWGAEATFFVAAGLGLLGLLLLAPLREPVATVRQSYSYRGFLQVASAPLLLVASGISILIHFVGTSTSFAFIPIYGADIGASKAALGYIIAAMFAFSALGSLAYVWVDKRLGYRHTIALSSLVMLGAVAVTPLIRSVPLLGVCQAASGFGRGILGAALAAMSIRAVAPSQRATATGVYQAVYSVGMLAGPVLSGIVADSLGIDAVFYLAGGVCLISAMAAYLPVVPAR